MKVICIDGVKIGDIGYNVDATRPANSDDIIFEGEIYTVMDEWVEPRGNPVFSLMERSPFNMYKQCRFVPLSQIDETYLLAERYGVYAENNFK